ncbi:MAG: FkbM family methyltransferase, partial [Flavobacteriales bacterium]
MRRILGRMLLRPLSEEARLIRAATAYPRHRPHEFRYRGRLIACTDFLSVAWQIAEIHGEEALRFPEQGHAPLIIDCGANVGINVLYQAMRHPGARIIAIEPDPDVFRCLELNVRRWLLQGVDHRRAAAWVHDRGVPFSPDGADGGTVAMAGGGMMVPSIRLRDELRRHARIDLLKMDIEGAETDVLLDCADELPRVDRLFVEYHSYARQPQRLHELLAVLARAGLRIQARRIGPPVRQPFM